VKRKEGIKFDFRLDQVKEFNRDFKPEDKVKLWTTIDDVMNAKREELLERSGLDPQIYGHVKYDVLKKIAKANTKHSTVQERRQYVLDTLAKLKEQQKDYITLKRQPPLTQGLLHSYLSSTSKKGGKRGLRRSRKTKKIFW